MPPPSPEQYNLPLTRWQQSWRYLLSLATSGFVWFQTAEVQWQHARVLFWVDLALGVLSFALVTQRRRWPTTVALATTALGSVSGSSAGPSVLAGVSLATRREVGRLVALAVVSVAAGQVFYLVEPPVSGDSELLAFSFSVVFTIAMIAVGMYVGSRRELLWSLRERAREAEREQELRMDRARALERERIAREMHDVLAHRISLVTMHAGALAYRTDLSPAQVRETAELISGTAHEALADLRGVLGTLRSSGDRDEPGTDAERASAERPQPRYDDVRQLVAEAERSGMRVRLQDLVERPVPERIGRTAYRIVQEALTNARKHAPGEPVTVTLSGSPESGLRLRVHNDTTPGTPVESSGSGLGLVGMQERLELAGGTLEVHREDGFTLRGWLPWPP